MGLPAGRPMTGNRLMCKATSTLNNTLLSSRAGGRRELAERDQGVTSGPPLRLGSSRAEVATSCSTSNLQVCGVATASSCMGPYSHKCALGLAACPDTAAQHRCGNTWVPSKAAKDSALCSVCPESPFLTNASPGSLGRQRTQQGQARHPPGDRGARTGCTSSCRTH